MALLAVSAFGLAGCSNNPESSVSTARGVQPAAQPPDDLAAAVTISIVPKSLDNPVFLDTKEAAQTRARELGVKLEWVAPFHADTAQQITILRWLINRGVDGILVSCNDPVALEPVINEGIAAGVRIATFDSDAPQSDRIFYIGTNNYEAGRSAADAAIELLGTNTEPKVAIVSGRREAHNLNERIRGFQARLEESARPVYLSILYSNDDINLAQELTEQAVTGLVDLDLIYFSGGWAFMGPLDSLDAYGRWLAAGGTAVTIDSHYPILIAARDGMVDALVGQDFAEMGRAGVSQLYNAILGQTVSSPIFTDTIRVNPDQVPLLLNQARNYELK